jgi:iron complex outermembrane recepter protein
MSDHHLRGSILALAAGLLVSPPSTNPGAAEENAVTLGELSVTSPATAPQPAPPPAAVQMPVSTSIVPSDPGAPPIVRRFQLPQTSASVTREQIDETVNVVDTEDAIKYFPSLFVRKRNEGDTQPVIETRTWGVNSSARTLVYADDVLISALIANNNTIGAPRWGIVAPEEIKRVDFL